MKKQFKPFSGEWRITEMEMWDQDFVNLLAPGFIIFDDDGYGSFQFGAVVGDIDARVELYDTIPRLQFSWLGSDDGDDTCGRGWCVIEEGELRGRLYFHMADDSVFRASKKK